MNLFVPDLRAEANPVAEAAAPWRRRGRFLLWLLLWPAVHLGLHAWATSLQGTVAGVFNPAVTAEKQAQALGYGSVVAVVVLVPLVLVAFLRDFRAPERLTDLRLTLLTREQVVRGSVGWGMLLAVALILSLGVHQGIVGVLAPGGAPFSMRWAPPVGRWYHPPWIPTNFVLLLLTLQAGWIALVVTLHAWLALRWAQPLAVLAGMGASAFSVLLLDWVFREEFVGLGRPFIPIPHPPYRETTLAALVLLCTLSITLKVGWEALHRRAVARYFRSADEEGFLHEDALGRELAVAALPPAQRPRMRRLWQAAGPVLLGNMLYATVGALAAFFVLLLTMYTLFGSLLHSYPYLACLFGLGAVVAMFVRQTLGGVAQPIPILAGALRTTGRFWALPLLPSQGAAMAFVWFASDGAPTLKLFGAMALNLVLCHQLVLWLLPVAGRRRRLLILCATLPVLLAAGQCLMLADGWLQRHWDWKVLPVLGWREFSQASMLALAGIVACLGAVLARLVGLQSLLYQRLHAEVRDHAVGEVSTTPSAPPPQP